MNRKQRRLYGLRGTGAYEPRRSPKAAPLPGVAERMERYRKHQPQKITVSRDDVK